MKRITLLTTLLITWGWAIRAQSVKESTVEYTNTKLPLTPLPASIKNYHVVLVAGYDERNKKLMEDYETEKIRAKHEYDSSLIQWAKDVKEAEEKYDAEMADWKKKSLGEKVVEKTVLKENNKPVKNIPGKPYPRSVPEPMKQTEYDLPLLADTYIKLDRYENNPVNALQIRVTLYGYDYTQPIIQNTEKNVLNFGSGSASTSRQTYYYSEYAYRHPMAVKAILPDGKEILNITPQQLNVYKTARSPELDKMPVINRDLLVRSTEEKTLQDNLTFINKLLNERFGFYSEKRKAVLYFVKDKKNEYVDLTTAFNEASTALIGLADDSARSRAALLDAADLWTKALATSDISNKDARIDKNVTIAICFDLLEIYYALKDHAAGLAIMQKMNGIGLSFNERLQKNDFDNLYSELKKRLSAN